MPQPKKAARFGNSASHHNMMMANLATELIRHGRIRTTLAKAKTVQPLAERMITFGKRGDLHARRQVLKVIRDKDVVRKLFDDVGPAFAERDGGYTRVLKLGARKGDAAPMALLEFTEGVSVTGEGDLAEAPRRRWSLRRRQGTQSASARARSEERAAAVDRGEDPDLLAVDETSAPDVDEGADRQAPPAEEPAPADATTAEGRVEADPAEVEARLAAEEEVAGRMAAGSDQASADEKESPEADLPEADLPEADLPDADAADDAHPTDDPDQNR